MRMIRREPAANRTPLERTAKHQALWRNIMGIVMVSAGCACFILSCVSAMVLSGRD